MGSFQRLSGGAVEMEEERSPGRLYNLCLKVMAENFGDFRLSIGLDVPESLCLDIFLELERLGEMDILFSELQVPKTFLRLLRVGDSRVLLHGMFQSVIDTGKNLHEILTEKIREFFDEETSLHFASFLSEAGWFHLAIRCLSPIPYTPDVLLSLLTNASSYCLFEEGYRYLHYLENASHPHLSQLYSAFSSFFFDKSEYRKAFTWSLTAIKSLREDLPVKILVDVLRQASKSYVVCRQFSKAQMLIQEAILITKETYGESHPKYADCLLDYGYYLLNADQVTKSLRAYQTSVDVRRKCFGNQNLLVAIALEGLAYATYVNEYNNGQFERAKGHAEKALSIMTDILPESHVLLASSQRVLALVLEEIALDSENFETSRRLLRRAEFLHESALRLSVKTFGETNVQTAKHYGNLGRLNQSMERYDIAEKMHLKAIKIKESLLGKDDYEVALSIGHLASLYNYDLKQYSKAETLYLRSINIGVKLFGSGYSGLEYDYRGLIRVYQEIEDWTKLFVYTLKLREWEVLQDQRNNDKHKKNSLSKRDPLSLSNIIEAVEDADYEIEELSLLEL